MKSSSRQLSRPSVLAASLLLAVGLLGGTVLGTAPTANAQIFDESGLFPSSSDDAYYADKYGGQGGSSSDSYQGYRAEGVPEPTLLGALALAAIGLTVLRRRPQKQKA